MKHVTIELKSTMQHDSKPHGFQVEFGKLNCHIIATKFLFFLIDSIKSESVITLEIVNFRHHPVSNQSNMNMGTWTDSN